VTGDAHSRTRDGGPIRGGERTRSPGGGPPQIAYRDFVAVWEVQRALGAPTSMRTAVSARIHASAARRRTSLPRRAGEVGERVATVVGHGAVGAEVDHPDLGHPVPVGESSTAAGAHARQHQRVPSAVHQSSSASHRARRRRARWDSSDHPPRSARRCNHRSAARSRRRASHRVIMRGPPLHLERRSRRRREGRAWKPHPARAIRRRPSRRADARSSEGRPR
jgi:hypothetical protein